MVIDPSKQRDESVGDMSGKTFPYEVTALTAPCLGLVALQSDETVEGDMRRLLPDDVDFMVTRVPSSEDVTSDTLAAMEGHLTAAAALFPQGARFDVVAYGCTSGAAQIGPAQVTAKIRNAVEVATVTQPLSSLVAACAHLGIKRLALLSPYVTSVSARLREALQTAGVDTPVFGSFDVGHEATVVRISAASIEAAALELMQGADVDALFLSCTNLRTLDSIALLEEKLDLPVLSSNQVLAWHMMTEAGVAAPDCAPGRLFRR